MSRKNKKDKAAMWESYFGKIYSFMENATNSSLNEALEYIQMVETQHRDYLKKKKKSKYSKLLRDLKEICSNKLILINLRSIVNNQIEQEKFSAAFYNLKKIQKDVLWGTYGRMEISDLFKDLDSKFQWLKERIREQRIVTFNLIRDAISNLKLTQDHISLHNILEESGISDKKLIRDVILELIRTKDITGEYFKSSDTLVIYKKHENNVAKKAIEISQYIENLDNVFEQWEQRELLGLGKKIT